MAGSGDGLRCRMCGAESPPAPVHYCADCFGPLEVVPAPLPTAPPLTPLVRAERLARRFGVERLWLKNEAANPTGSFKDRLVRAALAAARRFGLDTVACSSTGNLARSLLHHADGRAFVFVPEEVADAFGGPGVIAVRGTYDEANRLVNQLGEERGWGVVNVNLHPYYADGARAVGHEIGVQLCGRLPDHVVCCMAGGSLIGKVHQGMQEMCGPHAVRMHGAQPAGCNPIVAAVQAGRETHTPVRTPATRVHSLAVGDPGDGYFAIRLIRESGGWAEDVTDDEADAAADLLRREEGIDVELAGGVTVAATRKLIEQGRIERDAEIVIVLTGRRNTTTVTGPPPPVIEPTPGAFDRLLAAR